MSEPEILTEVPASLKLLVRIIMRCFYGDEHAVVMDKLIHHPCIKEDDLLELLRFERKQLRAVITSLRNEKVPFLRCQTLLYGVYVAIISVYPLLSVTVTFAQSYCSATAWHCRLWCQFKSHQ